MNDQKPEPNPQPDSKLLDNYDTGLARMAADYAAGKLGPRKGEAKAKPEYSRRRKTWQRKP